MLAASAVLLAVLIPIVILAARGGGAQPRNRIKEHDPSLMIDTEAWGSVPANQFLVLVEEGRGEDEARRAAEAAGGQVVGAVEDIGLYQVEYPGERERDLIAAIERAEKAGGIEAAFPDAEDTDRDIQGTPCGPTADPLYRDGGNGRAYEMTGLPEAWQMLRGARCFGVVPGSTHVGVEELEPIQRTSELRVVSSPGKANQGEVVVTISEGTEVSEGGEFLHSTAVTQVICADADNGGVAGGAAILGGDLTVTADHHSGVAQGISGIEELIRQGATIINMSYGPPSTGPENRGLSLAYRRLMERYPQVLFVAAAGNEDAGLDGENDLGGQPLPNLITVGALDTDGYPADFSNFEVEGGEVSISAPGVDIPVGVDPSDGEAINKSGTSFAAPQVAAAAALIHSIDPGLTASQIKQLILDEGSSTVKAGDDEVEVPDAMGGKALRVDNAVFAAVNGVRRKLGRPELTREQLMSYSRVGLKASGGPLEYRVTASLDTLSEGGTELRIDVFSVAAEIDGGTERSLSEPGSLTWKVTRRSEKEEVLVKVTRLDSLACSRVMLVSTPAGTYTGKLTMVESSPTGQAFTHELDVTVVIDDYNNLSFAFSGSGTYDIDAGGVVVTADYTTSGQLAGRLEGDRLDAAGSGSSTYAANIPGYGGYSSSQSLQVSASGFLLSEGRLEGECTLSAGTGASTAGSWWAEKQP